jgi:hypothetical protein
MARRRDGETTRRRYSETARWQDGKMTRRRDGKMARWRDGEMARRRPGSGPVACVHQQVQERRRARPGAWCALSLVQETTSPSRASRPRRGLARVQKADAASLTSRRQARPPGSRCALARVQAQARRDPTASFFFFRSDPAASWRWRLEVEGRGGFLVEKSFCLRRRRSSYSSSRRRTAASEGEVRPGDGRIRPGKHGDLDFRFKDPSLKELKLQGGFCKV